MKEQEQRQANVCVCVCVKESESPLVSDISSVCEKSVLEKRKREGYPDGESQE